MIYVMKMTRQMGLVLSLIMMALMLKSASAELYQVGDEFGWAIPPNATFYSEWANSKTFQIGDQILFNWTGSSDHFVGEVPTLAEYQNCTKPGIVFGDGITFTLIANGSRFFLSTVDDQCDRGMKVTVTVGSPTTTAPWWSASSGLPSPTFGGLLATMLLFMALINYF